MAICLGLAAFLMINGAGSHRRDGDGYLTIPHRWATRVPQAQAVDSIAAIPGDDGRLLLFATDKAAHRLDVFDAAEGDWLRAIAAAGEGFSFPNGIVAVTLSDAGSADAKTRNTAAAASGGDQAGLHRPKARGRQVLLVAERDSGRVLALSPEGAPLGAFGERVLRSPLGLAASRQGPSLLVYVTDTAGLAESRVHVFELSFALEGSAERVEARHMRSFGAEGQGDLDDPESIVVDDAFDRVFVCDERRRRPEVKLFRRDGRFIGTLGRGFIEGEPEGLALIDAAREKPTEGGWILVTDQRPELTVWHAFDRRDMSHVASFTGRPTIANTDGVCVHPASFGRFEQGALFAIHDDQEVRAYDLGEIVALLKSAKK